MRKKGPTIKDVAARAGVSVMAVSRVCNPGASGQVSAAMREKVMEAIKELGYQPDMVARSLRRRRSDTVGFYNGYRGMMLLDDDFPRSIFTGLQDESTELAQDLLIFNVPDEPRSPAEVVRELSTSKVDGVVFLPQEGDEELARQLGESHQNVVAIVEALPGLPAITAQDAIGSRKLAEYLYGLGHRHVIYRRARTKLMSARRRYEAFVDAAREIGIEVTETQTTLPFDELDDRDQEVIKHHKQRGITAVVTWRDYSAVKVVLFCREMGIDVPGDLAVVGFDQLTPLLCPQDVQLTTIAVDWAEIARRGVNYVVRGRDLAARVERGDEVVDNAGGFEIRLECPLFIGNTT